MISQNTSSTRPTHFLRAVELIIEARKKFNVVSENWTYPTEYRFGIPSDKYYSEVWIDGMDWQPSYWVIEEYQLGNPIVQPLIIFEKNEEREKFNEFDFKEFIMAMLYYRRDLKWIQKKEYGYYVDTVWPFLLLEDDDYRYEAMKLYSFEHASQEVTKCWVNTKFIPEGYCETTRKDYWNNRNSKKGYINCIPGN